MKKLSNRTINVIKKYLLLKLENNEISLNNFDEMNEANEIDFNDLNKHLK